MLGQKSYHAHFNRPLSIETIEQFQEFNELLDHTIPIHDKDKWSYSWNEPELINHILGIHCTN